MDLSWSSVDRFAVNIHVSYISRRFIVKGWLSLLLRHPVQRSAEHIQWNTRAQWNRFQSWAKIRYQVICQSPNPNSGLITGKITSSVFFTLFLKTISHPGIYHRTFKLSTSSTFNLLLFAMGDSGLSWKIKASHKCYFQYGFTVHSEISFVQLHHLVQARPWLCLVCNMISTQHLRLYSWRILPASTAVFPASNALALRKSSTCP